MAISKKNKRPRYKPIYKGFSFREQAKVTESFWSEVSLEAKFKAVSEVIRDAYQLKGIDFHALRFDRTTAIIRKV